MSVPKQQLSADAVSRVAGAGALSNIFGGREGAVVGGLLDVDGDGSAVDDIAGTTGQLHGVCRHGKVFPRGRG